MEWWQPEVGDLVCDTKYQPERVLALALDGDYEDYIVPLLTAQQLIDYIEWRLQCTVGVEYNDRNMNVILVAYYVLDCLDNSVEKSKQEFNTDDLMQALWECVQSMSK